MPKQLCMLYPDACVTATFFLRSPFVKPEFHGASVIFQQHVTDRLLALGNGLLLEPPLLVQHTCCYHLITKVLVVVIEEVFVSQISHPRLIGHGSHLRFLRIKNNPWAVARSERLSQFLCVFFTPISESRKNISLYLGFHFWSRS